MAAQTSSPPAARKTKPRPAASASAAASTAKPATKAAEPKKLPRKRDVSAGTAKRPSAPVAKKGGPAAPDVVVMVEAAPVLRKKELLERVIKRSGEKKKAVKPIVEATLGILGEALAAGEELVLPPFGKARVNRQKDVGSAEMLVIKLRRQGDKPAGAAEGATAAAD